MDGRGLVCPTLAKITLGWGTRFWWCLFLNQRGLAGRAIPARTLFDPGIGETSTARIRLSIHSPLFDVSATHDHGVLVGLCDHGVISEGHKMFGRMLEAFKELGPGLETAIDVDVEEIVRASPKVMDVVPGGE